MNEQRTGRRGRLIAILAGGVALSVIAAAAVVIMGDGAAPPPPPRQERPFRKELVERAHPDPACAERPAPRPDGSGEVAIGVLRLQERCLVSATVATTETEADRVIAELRAEPDVVAADRVRQTAPPGYGRYESGEGRSFEQEARESLGGERLLDLWPEGAPEIRVAMIDAGVDASHPELAGRVVATRDTVLGAKDHRDHGTFNAGIVAAAADGQGITGITPNAKLLDVQYYRDGEGWPPNQPGIHDEIIWSVDHGARVLSVSATDHGSSMLDAAYAYAELNGVVAVAAVGNCGSWLLRDDYCGRRHDVLGQADQPTVLGVGATTDGDRAGYSPINRTVQLVAPGGAGDDGPVPGDPRLVSTCINDQERPRTHCRSHGTSFAEPYVAAAAALLAARHPDASPAEIRIALIMSANQAGLDLEPGQRNDEYGYGRLDILAAAKYLDDHPPAPPPGEKPVIAAATITEEGGSHRTDLVLTDGLSIEVQALGATRPELAFSADGDWFAATDGKVLTVADARTGKQQSTGCTCLGVAFNSKGELLTLQGAGGIEILRYDARSLKINGSTSGTGLDSADIGPAKIVGAAGDSALITMNVGGTDAQWCTRSVPTAG
ncbi:S8 family peptidase [Microlunatus parietis]|uniref:Subtilisin family serine protease n=1 Tax=Microlunatus parietis TaxID=682979 RepID=A0A7Y9I211_9ACTN|nr:S8 family serine peptidase [Microlunatus parietis]NYE68723.1 subtilisin family serine protease [Microlunatus parietis]